MTPKESMDNQININPWALLTETELTAFRNALNRAEQALAEARDAAEGQTDVRMLQQPLARSLPRARHNLTNAWESLSLLSDLTRVASERWLDQVSQSHPNLLPTANSVIVSTDLTQKHP